MRAAISDAVALRRSIANTFRAVRTHRKMRVQSTADAMAMSIRAYSNLEAARSRASFEDVVLFSQVTDSDLFGVVAAIALNTPDLAVHGADNKIGLIIQLLLRDLDASAGADVSVLTPDMVLSSLKQGFDQLSHDAQALAAVQAREQAKFRKRISHRRKADDQA